MSFARLPPGVKIGSPACNWFRNSSFSVASVTSALMYRELLVLPINCVIRAATAIRPVAMMAIATITSINVKPLERRGLRKFDIGAPETRYGDVCRLPPIGKTHRAIGNAGCASDQDPAAGREGQCRAC